MHWPHSHWLSLSQHTHDLAQVTAWLTPIVTPGLMGGGWSLSTWSGLIQATDHNILNPQYSRHRLSIYYGLISPRRWSTTITVIMIPHSFCKLDYSAHCLMIVSLIPIPHQHHSVSPCLCLGCHNTRLQAIHQVIRALLLYQDFCPP